jgi:hypothetical protein
MSDANSSAAIAGGVGTACSVLLFVIYKLLLPFFTVANHKRVRSSCCGRTCVSSLDFEDTTPRIQPVANPALANPASMAIFNQPPQGA